MFLIFYKHKNNLFTNFEKGTITLFYSLDTLPLSHTFFNIPEIKI